MQLSQPLDVGRLSQRIVNHRPLASSEFQIHPHRLQNRQEIAEDDRRIHAQPADRGEHHLGCEAWIFAQLHEADFLSHASVFWQIAAGLPHQPDGSPLHGLAPAGSHHERLTEAIGGYNRCHAGSITR